MSEFDDLIPKSTNDFADLVPKTKRGVTDLTAGELKTLIPAAAEHFSRPFKRFGQGLAYGASFGKVAPSAPSETQIVPARSELEDAFLKTGKFVGGMVPLALSEGLSALPAAAAGSRFAWGPVEQAVGSAAMSGATYAGLKGAVQNKPPLEVALKDIPADAATFAGLGMGGQVLGYLRKGLGENWAENMSNVFLNTPNKISVKRLEQGKPSLGEEILTSPELGDATTRKSMFNKAQIELASLENQVQNNLNNASAGIKTESSVYPFANVPQQAKTVDAKPIVDNLSQLFGEGTHFGSDKDIVGFINQIKSRGNTDITLQEANTLRRMLDSKVGNRYLNVADNVPRIEEMENAANYLRGQISEISPEVGQLLGRQHLMLQAKQALGPIAIDKRRISDMSGFGFVYDKLHSTMAVPRALRSTMGTPSTRVAPLTRLGLRSAIEDAREENQ